MTILEQAIAHYKYGISYDIFSEPVTTYAQLSVDALEKQILKTPICKKYSDDTRCPICNTFVLYGNKHCIECGQALDWS